MDKELAEAVKLFISQPLNNHLTRGQIMEVARIALPILEQQERGGGWIEWRGGNCPVLANSRVDIKFRDGDIGLEQSANWDWSHRGYRSDIIAYRIIPEQPLPSPPEED